MEKFDAAKLPEHRLVALSETATVRSWAAAAVSDRCVYSGVVEHSVYVHPDACECGVGRTGGKPSDPLRRVGVFEVCVVSLAVTCPGRGQSFSQLEVALSIRPVAPGEVPAETARVTRAVFPNGSLAIRIRDELGVLFRDEQFADLFAVRGRPAWSPGRLALVLVLPFVEGLTDRQAAEAVRARIDVKYALGLELTDPGFDYSVLSEFRARLTDADAGRRVLDGILSAARVKGCYPGGGKARTDSTHVLSTARELTWLELVAETLRAALNELARTAPDWLTRIAEPDWFKHYATRAENSRFPKTPGKRDEIGLRIAADGARLLDAIATPEAPTQLRNLPQIKALRKVWAQQLHPVDGQLRRRKTKERPPGALRLVTPYDIEAHGSVKRGAVWDATRSTSPRPAATTHRT